MQRQVGSKEIVVDSIDQLAGIVVLIFEGSFGGA
jgi:hypothetical protein